ncbi:TonB-dependent receptor [Kordiimonas aquimaris]|uniref:TonB-dependent receptor n=1 Tax=Kordiimonas aquimaris TaxID=707591 RepID=UPI0021D0F256|nr:TonB-dependent receptor [Kordiimonas aquimaris]
MKKYLKMSVATCALTIAGINNQILAQDEQSEDPEFAFEEIVVTARGREESLKSAPLSVSVLSKQTIEDARVNRVDDFIALTSGITIANSQDAGTNFITIRGMSQTRNGEPPVAVIVDGVLQVNSRTFDQTLFDVENIQVLRGPQGARYGRNATGGAIIINTVGPSESFEGYVRAGVGSGEEYSVEGSISGPITEDTLSYRLSGSYTNRDGVFENFVLDENVDYFEDVTVRGHLLWTPTSNFSADARVNIIRTDAGSLNFSYQPAIVDPVTGLPNFDFTIADADLVERNFSANNLGLDDRDVTQFSLRMNYQADWGEFSSVTSYDSITQSTGSDQFPYTAASSVTFGAFPFFDGTQSQFFDIDAFSQEIRFTSNSDQRLRWMAGAYLLLTDRFVSSSIANDLEQGITRVRREPVSPASSPLTSFIADDNDNTAYAFFAAVDYDIAENLELSFAGRYDRDERKQTVSPDQGLYANGVVVTPVGAAGAVNQANFGKFQPKVSLRYIATEDFSIYGSWGQGFRSGQFNQNGVGAIAAGAGVSGVSDLLGKETTDTFEAGWKSTFLDNRVSLNGALYHTTVKNAPYFVFIGAVSAQVLVPIDEVTIKGGELELTARVTPNLDFYAGLAISDSEVNEYNVTPSAVGNEAPYVPKSALNIGGQYRTEITSDIGLFMRVDYERRGRQFWDPENTTERSAINLVNARLGIEDNDGAWSLTGSVTNLFDEVYNSEWVLGGFAHAGQPDIWRLDFRYNF